MSPSFSDTTRKKIEDIVSHYPRPEAALLPVLHLAQREFGQIGTAEEMLVAETLGIKPISVREVVTFYTMFQRTRIGRYHIQVCSNLSCALQGVDSLLEHLMKKLKLKPGETSEDGRFTLSTVECLGACEQSPCMMVNDDTIGNLDKIKIDEILEGLE